MSRIETNDGCTCTISVNVEELLNAPGDYRVYFKNSHMLPKGFEFFSSHSVGDGFILTYVQPIDIPNVYVVTDIEGFGMQALRISQVVARNNDDERSPKSIEFKDGKVFFYYETL